VTKISDIKETAS